MRRKRRLRKKMAAIAVLLILCVLALAYIIKMVGDMKEQRDIARAEEMAQSEAEAAETAEAEEESQEAAGERSENVYAYRGSSDDAAYSMAAYDSAVEAGAGALVLPFVVSQDGTMYVADDDYAEDMTGYGGYFSGMTDGQIDNLETKSGGKILKLSDVLDKYGRDVDYVIELKYTSERNQMALRDLISKYDYADIVSISSSYFSGLRSLDYEFPNIPKLFVCSAEDEWSEALIHDYVDAISVSGDMMSEDRCRTAHDNDKKFGAGILNSADEISKAREIGADFFFTDEAALAAGAEE